MPDYPTPDASRAAQLTASDMRFLRGIVKRDDKFPIPHAGLTKVIERVLNHIVEAGADRRQPSEPIASCIHDWLKHTIIAIETDEPCDGHVCRKCYLFIPLASPGADFRAALQDVIQEMQVRSNPVLSVGCSTSQVRGWVDRLARLLDGTPLA